MKAAAFISICRLVFPRILCFCVCLLIGRSANADTLLDSALTEHPAAEALQRLFSDQSVLFKPTGITKHDYLTLIAADVNFFRKYQNSDGAIIDPYQHEEIQYSTPSFAVAAAILATQNSQKDLLEPATRALSCSITALVNHRAANGHSDFYIPLIMHAYGLLRDAAPGPLRAHWEDQLRQIDIATAYNVALRGMNWNVVSSCGELLRRQAGLVPPDRMPSQMDYLETSLAGHAGNMTRFGMYHDPNSPLAYDEFARLWLEDMMAHGAYDGKLAGKITDFLRLGGLSTLLLLSPSGEWANGGRSALHNWNEAETAEICEINANKWARDNRPQIAGAFKRAAHLALISMRRWQRPSGDLWIIKNRFPPESRFAYEVYSYHTQYNLLPMAMLAMAYEYADDAIAERPTPAEIGGYVFDVRETFHKVVAAAGGYYVEIDTAADPHYNATGLQRVQKAGVEFSPLSDSSAAQRAYGPKGGPDIPMTPGLQWTDAGSPDKWHSLADFAGDGPDRVAGAELTVTKSEPSHVEFTLDYNLSGPDETGRQFSEQYTLTSDGVRCDDAIFAGPSVAQTRLRFPALVNDGAADTHISINGPSADIDDRGSDLRWVVLDPADSIQLKLDSPRVICHSGYLQPLVAVLPSSAHPDKYAWQIQLTETPRP